MSMYNRKQNIYTQKIKKCNENKTNYNNTQPHT